ncbi:LrgB family protein [Desulfuribacillus stibiiarsenatis]|uniref:LrgB family protein n=1 Tax=Desulfuribacillus stibiiarsenatis TaxID=1390249 RepID=UPI00159F19DD|nr:LrgB family protein [Desulfuribacillus stibiiarsenatis]
MLAYILSLRIGSRYPNPFTTPVFLGTAMIISTFLLLGLTYETYKPAREIITFFLGPATVALAIPLYKRFAALKKHWLPALTGVVYGTIIAILCAASLSYVFHFNRDMTLAMITKGVTVPIALEITHIFQGDPALAAAFVVATGTAGTMLGPWLMDVLKISDPMARGVAMGTIAHGQGTAAAMREGELQGAMAGVAMGVAAIFTAFIAPILLPFLLP